MARLPPFSVPPRVPAVEPELLASAIFLFGEYLATLGPDLEDEEAETEIDTSAVLDLFAEDLGTSVSQTLTLYMRVTALYRLLSRVPSIAQRALDSGALTEDALLAAARLDLRVRRSGREGSADFDPQEFRAALETG